MVTQKTGEVKGSIRKNLFFSRLYLPLNLSKEDCLLLAVYFVGYGQFRTAFGTTGGQHATAIGGQHALTETMFVVSLSVVRLECSFHCDMLFYLYSEMPDSGRAEATTSGCKFRQYFCYGKTTGHFFLKLRQKSGREGPFGYEAAAFFAVCGKMGRQDAFGTAAGRRQRGSVTRHLR